MFCQDQEPLITKVCQLYDQISRLDSLKPSKDVDTLFTELVLTCIPPSPIDVTKLCSRLQRIRSNLIRLCGRAEGHLETHFATLLASFQNPLHQLHIFPYYDNYLKLSQLEYDILIQNFHHETPPRKIAFVGSGPLPLTSIVLASNHLKTTSFHNYDIDPLANSMALALVSSDPDLSKRMLFHTTDIMDVAEGLEDYDVVFLAALVGMDVEEKARVIDHVAEHMSPGALLMLRSAHGARAFLYPVVDPCDLRGRFDVLTVYHPSDEVINSVVLARKLYNVYDPVMAVKSSAAAEKQGNVGVGTGPIVLPSKCFHEIEAFNPLNIHGKYMVEELSFEEKLA